MALQITLEKEIERYFDSPDINQSLLKGLIPGLEDFKHKQEKRENSKDEPMKEHFLIGHAVDDILTGEEGIFEKKYYISEIENKPSDTEVVMVDTTIEIIKAKNIQPQNFEDHRIEILESIEYHGWYKNKPGEKRIETFINGARDYFRDKINSEGKHVLSTSQNALVGRVVDSLRSNYRTSQFFNRETIGDERNMRAFYQLPIHFQYEGVNCKALLDMLFVSFSEENKVSRVVIADLKTMSGETVDFLNNVKMFRYDIQMAWYKRAVEFFLREGGFDFQNVEIECIFVVESVTRQGTPVVYRASDSLLEIGEFGKSEGKIVDPESGSYIFVRPVKGYKRLIEEYKYYLSTDWTIDYRLKNTGQQPLVLTWDKFE